MNREDREALFCIAERNGNRTIIEFLDKIKELNNSYTTTTDLENRIYNLIATGNIEGDGS